MEAGPLGQSGWEASEREEEVRQLKLSYQNDQSTSDGKKLFKIIQNHLLQEDVGLMNNQQLN